MSGEDVVRYFGLNNVLIEHEIKRVEKEHEVDFGHRDDPKSPAESDAYYPQFPARLREEARKMAIHYEIFYCLENEMRQLISDRLFEASGADWWDACVPQSVRDTARKNTEREAQQGVTPRSEMPIDYINFGELGQIMSANWSTFGDMLKNKLAVERILGQLNLLRGPIAHCKALADDEVDRLELSLRDWFRQLS
jgi:hypothetical protein